MSCIRTGAYVSIPDYGIHAPVDLYQIGDAIIVRFNGDPTDRSCSYGPPWRPITHVLHVNRYPQHTYIRFDTGTLVLLKEAIESTEFDT